MKQYRKVTTPYSLGYGFDSFSYNNRLIIRDTNRVNFYPYYNSVDSVPGADCVPRLIGDK